MIIELSEAQQIYAGITQEKLDGLENYIRSYTSNNFQVFKIRIKGLLSFKENEISGIANFLGFKVGDTIEVSQTVYNDGLYVIESMDEANGTLKVADDSKLPFIEFETNKGFITKVSYPPAILSGVRDILNYEEKTKDNIGVKSETISRWTRTFVNPNDGRSQGGYPEHLMNFLDEFVIMDWG